LQKLTRNNIKGPYGGFEIELDKFETTTLRLWSIFLTGKPYTQEVVWGCATAIKIHPVRCTINL
jgi:hypothetical protein